VGVGGRGGVLTHAKPGKCTSTLYKVSAPLDDSDQLFFAQIIYSSSLKKLQLSISTAELPTGAGLLLRVCVLAPEARSPGFFTLPCNLMPKNFPLLHRQSG
jgi:hypothetical protein